MVIGHGMIAERFLNYREKNEYIIFASGVSDSTHLTAAAIERETKLLQSTIRAHKEKKMVYFSTCSIYDAGMQNGAYVKHKKQMEALIAAEQDCFIIFRLSNPIGKTANNHTFFNFFIQHIINNKPFEIWQNASRNIIDIDDMHNICNEILQQGSFLNTTVNIANPENYPVPYIIKNIEDHFGIQSRCKWLDKGDGPKIDTSQIEILFRKFNINFDENYLPNLLKKYFPV